MLDILIKNGTVIDGTGKPGFLADVALQDGVIQDVGALKDAKAHTVTDAEGRYVAPGFIDVTNHSDVTTALFSDPSLASMALQGVTTILGGNCGVSLAPFTDPDIVHGIRRWSGATLNVNWLSLAEFLAEVEKRNLALNFGTFAGHGTIRRGVTNEAPHSLTLEEFAKFKSMLAEALDQGALGLSANLSGAHEHHASVDELAEIAKVMAAHGGVFKLHLRNEGTGLIAAVNEALRIGNEGEVPIAISHLKAVGRKSWGLMRQALTMIEGARRGGERVLFDISPYATTGSHLSSLLPEWAREGGYAAMLLRFKDPEVREKILTELKSRTLHFDRLAVAEAEDGASSGKTLADLADRMSLDPNEVILELLAANRGRVTIIGKTLKLKNIELGISTSEGIIASNGAAVSREPGMPRERLHPRSFGAFPHFLHRYVRDTKLLSWEHAIQKITSIPAEFFRLGKRGQIAKHYAADIVVFDPNTIADRATYANPFRAPVGIDRVIVNGIPVASAGAMTGQRPGQVIRRS